MKRIEIYENGINIVFEITDDNEAKLLHFSALPLMKPRRLHTWG